MDDSQSLQVETGQMLPPSSLRERVISGVGQHTLSSMISHRNPIAQRRFNPIHLTQNQPRFLKCPPTPSRKYLDIYNKQHEFNDQRFNTFTPIRTRMQPQVFTPTHRANGPLDVSQYEEFISSQPLQLSQSPQLRSTPRHSTMNWTGLNSEDCNTNTFQNIRNHNQIYSSMQPQLKHMYHYKYLKPTDVRPNSLVMTPNRTIPDGYTESRVSMPNTSFMLNEQNFIQSTKKRHSYSIEIHGPE